MGSSSQSICYPIATTSARNIVALNRVLADLCTRSDPKDGAVLTLRRLVEEVAHDLSGEVFARFMDHLYERITIYLDSNEVFENIGALRATYELIDVTISENASKVAKFSNYMRAAFETKHDPEILVLASKVLGHLARSGGAMTADEVERQVKFALEWLRGKRIEYRRFAAVLILKEMAKNASTVFNVHMLEFVDAIWVALRDPTLAIRGKVVEALRACLRVIEKRETRYYRMFEATQYGLGRNAFVHSIHGSLLAVGELLRNIGEFMMSRHRKVAEIVLRYLEHRDRLVRLCITSLLPRIAHFLRDQFVPNYLMIAPRRGRPSLEALAYVGNIAKAMGPTMEPHVRGLLDSMFSSGLSLTLVEALEQITESIPPLLPTIQNRLLDFISTILSRSHHSMPRQSASGYDLLEFARESVVVYLEFEDGDTRKDVALCRCKIVANSFSAISSTQFSPSKINRASGKRRHRVVEEVYF
ncbi:Serine/threonine-protein kinase TOR [Capsicum baccatum]|uniref:Serine/threonine-protein kinase TOR n=1 Tax=Capsicum baccatum TaxID=33114 RepID=A0A2G2V665_CAPBA|nr:Serine/threonine-protein kinase TOR [Capsicum baccatum]